MAKKPSTTSAKSMQSGDNRSQAASGQAQAAAGQQQSAPADAVALLKGDHRKVEQLFAQYESAGSDEQKRELARQLCTELIIHTKLEEEIFYPACREKAVEHDALDEAQVEHDSAKILITELMSQDPDSEYYDAKVSVLSEYIKHHVGEEEKPSDGIFAMAKTAQVDMNALGQRLQARKQELLSKAETQGFRPPQPRALELSLSEAGKFQEYQAMDRRYDRDRDEQGRFTSDDDYRDFSRGRRASRYGGRDDDNGRSSRGRDDDNGRSSRSNERERDEYGRFMSDDDDRYSRSRDDDRYSRSRGSQERERDEYGRFTSDDDRGGRYSSRSSGRDYDDDDDYRSARRSDEGRGWSGDSRGHAETAQRGWENRGNWRGSSRSDDDDDDNRSSRGRGQGSGWYGDPRGHAEAARRGWDDRGGSRSRSRDDDDDDRRGSSRSSGHGGWFGDSRGHSQAARRGWQHRD
jgi:hypothetical protein